MEHGTGYSRVRPNGGGYSSSAPLRSWSVINHPLYALITTASAVNHNLALTTNYSVIKCDIL